GQHGAYDSKTAMLTTTDTKVYETKHGLDPAMAATTGLPAGASLHLTLVNKPYKDNRIPPRGFTNAAFEAIQSGHFGYHYADGQYWDDTLFAVPQGATRADVVVYYQTMSRDYAEFLRDTNTAPAPNAGTQLWDAYVATGMGAPQVMDEYSFKIASSTAGLPDIANVIQNWGRSVPLGTDGDYSHNGSVGLDDIAKIIQGWATVRP
ncbi:MAG TPA: hypothetical protein VG797_02345, partial [Phycisphaerales bacterium]|nr:hypothetical protein [Phycisphaerales bacterium]